MTTAKHHPDEAFIGKQLEPRSFEISKKTVDDYFEGLKVDRRLTRVLETVCRCSGKY